MKKYCKPIFFMCGLIIGICLSEILELESNKFMWVIGAVFGSIGGILFEDK